MPAVYGGGCMAMAGRGGKRHGDSGSRLRWIARALLLGLVVLVLSGVTASALNWNQVPSGTSETLYDTTFAHGIFVAVGSNGTILTSPSGGAWAAQSSGTTTILNGVASANGGGPPGSAEWVVVGHNGTVLYSPVAAANSWLPVPAGGLPPGLGAALLEQITYGGPAGGKLYVAVGWGGTIITSPDGLTWSQPTSGTAANLADAEYGGGQFVVAGWGGTILTSPNGSAWTAQSSGTGANLYDLAHGSGTWVAVGAGGTILYSPNGVTWTAAASGTGLDLYDVIFDGCRFVAAGAGGTILTSPDGINWTPDSSGVSASLFGLAAGNGVDVAVGTGGTVLVAKGCQPSPSACAPLPAGAVAWWPLNETAGATAVADLVGGHTGTPMSGPVGSGGPNPTAGMVGGALYFYLDNTYVRVPDSPALNFGTGDFTIDAWVNPVQVGPAWFQPIVDKVAPTGTPGGAQGYRLYIKNGQLLFELFDGNTSALVAAPAGTISYGTWQFVAAERAGGALNLYVNGALAATATLPSGFGSVSNTADLLVGGITAVGFPAMPIIGEIALDEVELFNRAVSQQELQTIYQAGPTGKCPPADLEIKKELLTSPVVAGQPVSYQITVTNVGGSPWSGWIGFSDPLPAGAGSPSFTAPAPWSCSVSGGVLMCTYNGGPGFSLPPGQSLPPVTVTFTVPAGVSTIKNCARVFAQNMDANPSNNLSCSVADVLPPPPGGSCAKLPAGAVAWWPLNETAGATAVTDLVGGHTGTPSTMPGVPAAVGSLLGPKPVAGMVGGALLFDRDDWVQVPNSPALNFAGAFTVDAWVYAPPQSAALYQAIVDKVQAVTGTPTGVIGYRLYVKNGNIHFELSDGNSVATVTAPAWFPYGTWVFVAAERTANSLDVYVNGTLAATAALPAGFGSVGNGADLLLGQITTATSPPAPNPSDGWIALDEVEIFSQAVSPQDLQAIYQAGPKGKCPPQPVGKPDLAITKVQEGPAVVGMNVYYQIYVANVGTAPMPGPITVTDHLPAGVVLQAAGGPAGSGWACSPSPPPPVPGPVTVTCTHPGPVPAGGSLPPIIIQAKVTGKLVKPGSLTNCASVTGPNAPGTTLPLDQNPANDKACVTSPVGLPGAICGVKWLDTDGDGVHDPGEPGLSGWTIEIRDAAGNLVATVVTGKGGRYCYKPLVPGTYTVGEVLQPGWIQTAPQPAPPGTHTVTVASGQTVTGVDFGNRPQKIGPWWPIGVPVNLPVSSPDLWVGKYVYDSSRTAGCLAGCYYAQVIFGIDVTNVGNAPTPASFTVNDSFPAGFQVFSVNASGWSCTPAALPAAGPVTVSCSFGGTLAPGQTAHLEITVRRPLSAQEFWAGYYIGTNCAALVPNPWDPVPANDQACIAFGY